MMVSSGMHELCNSLRIAPGAECWSEAEWETRDSALRVAVLASRSEAEAFRLIAREARTVLKTYSSNFFTVTRFLPPAKRVQVEAIYAAVRYPDEIVDTFPIVAIEKSARLAAWRAQYERALEIQGLRAMVVAGVPCFIAGFVQVMRDTGIPAEYYRAFLNAMVLDVHPRKFETMDDLIDSYIYGSAVVVGYFLAYVYGASHTATFADTLESARRLGIALQLTNFLRDVAEDQRRGRQYLPLDLLANQGIHEMDATNPNQHSAIARVVKEMCMVAAGHYAYAASTVDTFSPDSRTAIRACIDVYGELNERILHSSRSITHRESVPLSQKLRVLPASKYWRIPLAYLGW
ncbi:MAG: phytoene/squalene synthase family protein [Candidatus Hydrogenedentes bacterium]|nr:phytoene/squalene synthase family protein [Candidatus Hydrogenedentota bacterium]